MDGHHGAWLSWLVRGLLEQRYRVTVGTSEEYLDHPVISLLNAEANNEVFRFRFFSRHKKKAGIASLFDLVGNEVRHWYLFRNIYLTVTRTSPIHAVVLPYLDYCTYSMALFGSPFGRTPWIAVAMRPAFHLWRMGLIPGNGVIFHMKEMMFARLLKIETLITCFSIDELLVSYVCSKKKKYTEKLSYLADPVEFTGGGGGVKERGLYGIPSDSIVVLLYGATTERKNAIVLIDALKDERVPKRVRLLFVGRQDAKIKALYRSLPSDIAARIHLVDKYITSDEERNVFEFADCVWLGYRRHYQMSGVLVLAAKARLPVIGCKEGLIGYYVRRFSNGIAVDATDVSAVADALVQVSKCPTGFQAGVADAAVMFSRHTIASAISAIASTFQRLNVR